MANKSHDAIERLKLSIENNIICYALTINGKLNIQTVATSEQQAAAQCLVLSRRTNRICLDPDCNCNVDTLAQLVPEAKMVKVKIEVLNAS